MVRYEWVVELVCDIDCADGAAEDVIEVHHEDSYLKAQGFVIGNPVPSQYRYDIGLVRDDDHGRSWAYVEDGKIGPDCLDAYGNVAGKVPVAFVRAVAGYAPPANVGAASLNEVLGKE